MAQTIRLGAFTPSVLLRVARRLGRLDDAGIDVVETLVPSSPAQFQSLLDGTYDAILTSPDNVLARRCQPEPADVKIVSAVDRGLGLALYSGTSDLRGATFAVDVPDSGFAFAMYALAESLGLSRDDYHVVALGSTPKRLAALLAGECDATMLNAGNELHAEAAGFWALARVSTVCRPYLGTVLAARDPAPVAGLARALTSTAAVISVYGAVDALVIEEAGKALKLPTGLATRYLHRLRAPSEGLVVDGLVDLASIRTLVDLRRRYGPPLDGDPFAAALEPDSGLRA
jgi:ABC-type nitrate/sulfonate/bicarbonate transport system substrate-binding protein